MSLDLWEKRETETTRAFAAFAVYRDLGERRSLLDAARRFYEDPNVGKTSAKRRQMERWSTQHAWVSRAEAYDASLEQWRRMSREAALKEADERHARDARELQKTMLGRVRAAKKTSVSAAVRGYEVGVKIERTALGKPDETDGIGDIRDVTSIIKQLVSLLPTDLLQRITDAPDGAKVRMIAMEAASLDPQVRVLLDLMGSAEGGR